MNINGFLKPNRRQPCVAGDTSLSETHKRRTVYMTTTTEDVHDQSINTTTAIMDFLKTLSIKCNPSAKADRDTVIDPEGGFEGIKTKADQVSAAPQ